MTVSTIPISTDWRRERACQEIVRRIILNQTITRNRVADEVGLSLASITNYTRWLRECGFVSEVPLRMSHSKRPVQLLKLNPDAGYALSMMLSLFDIHAEILDLSLTPIATFHQRLESPDQVAVMQGIASVADQACKHAEQIGCTLSAVGLGVSGSVAPEHGIIFSLDGIERWEPCQPRILIKPLRKVPAVKVWTQIACKVRGLGARLKQDTGLCYAQFTGRHFHIAAMRDGDFTIGRYGTSGQHLHRQVVDDGPVCFCGIRGCLWPLYKAGKAKPVWLCEALYDVLQLEGTRQLAIEGAEGIEQMAELLRKQSCKTCIISDGLEIALEGLRALTAQTVLDCAIHQREISGG